ncbi:hypothetical protein I7I48_02528 [Histoplasma ohiense]|nr:hypothetical protein I7I48_02528 [Histoplasma ohiense (nom. inval.)]
MEVRRRVHGGGLHVSFYHCRRCPRVFRSLFRSLARCCTLYSVLCKHSQLRCLSYKQPGSS